MRQAGTRGVGVCAALAVAAVAAVQGAARPASQEASDGKVGVTIALQAGGDSYRFTGRASCTHAPTGYIYAVPARLWTVEQSDGTHHVMLTLWRPVNGSGDMFTLYVQGGRTYKVDTVKTEDGGSPEGSGQVTFASAGAGGTFTVRVTTADGATINGSIACDAFRAAVAEGGN